MPLTQERREKLVAEIYCDLPKPQPLPYEVQELLKVFDWCEDVKPKPLAKATTNRVEPKVEVEPLTVEFDQL